VAESFEEKRMILVGNTVFKQGGLIAHEADLRFCRERLREMA
jgi:hypothetical protein